MEVRAVSDVIFIVSALIAGFLLGMWLFGRKLPR